MTVQTKDNSPVNLTESFIKIEDYLLMHGYEFISCNSKSATYYKYLNRSKTCATSIEVSSSDSVCDVIDRINKTFAALCIK